MKGMSNNKYLTIGIIEDSDIIREGIQNLLQKSGQNIVTFLIKDIDNLNIHANRLKLNIILINTSLIISRLKQVRNARLSRPDLKWIGLQSSFPGKEILSCLDEIIYLDDTAEIITRKVIKFAHSSEKNKSAPLSSRETDVLLEMIKGYSNKEIAEKLNISIHTVMTHRKNIYAKTGTRSQPGLTIFALTHNIASIDNLK